MTDAPYKTGSTVVRSYDECVTPVGFCFFEVGDHTECEPFHLHVFPNRKAVIGRCVCRRIDERRQVGAADASGSCLIGRPSAR
jgi:hypothetical protein